MKWIAREKPKLDRLACPRLINHFIDPAAAVVTGTLAGVVMAIAATILIAFSVVLATALAGIIIKNVL